MIRDAEKQRTAKPQQNESDEEKKVKVYGKLGISEENG